MHRRTRAATAGMAAALTLLAGTACRTPNGGPPTSTTATTVTPTTGPSPTTGPTPTTAPTPTTGPTPTTPPAGGAHVDNPFAGAKGYVNEDWAKQVRAEADKNAALAAKMRTVAQQPTAVWLDRIAAIAGGNSAMGLEQHLQAALRQAQGGQPVVATFVIYDLPGRDCAAVASNGELKPDELPRYKREYIDPIAAILAKPEYRSLRIATIVEPDSLPNLTTNVSSNTATTACQTVNSNGAYVDGVAYALEKLHAVPNVYTYVDLAHSGWLGWDSNRDPAAAKMVEVAQKTPAKFASIDGFITNTANYTPTKEPFLPSGEAIKQSKFYDWNAYPDEASFGEAMYQALVAKGFPSSIGMLIDTGRNGWGGPDRPKAATPNNGDVNAWVDANRIDRRIHRGNWCNQDRNPTTNVSNSGIGERPRATPAPHFDAYVWVKPPGESDGAATKELSYDPTDPSKGFDPMCSEDYGGNGRNGNSNPGAMKNAPVAGRWFSEGFVSLVKNAYPAL